MKRKLIFLIFILSIFMQLSIVNSEVFAQDDNLQNFEYQYYNVEKQEQNSELDKIISKPKQGADVPLGTIEPGDAEKAAVMQSWTYGPGTTAKAQFQETFTNTGIESVKRKWDANRARNEAIDNPMLSVEEATKTYGKYGLKFDKPIKKQEAELLAKRKIESQFRQEKIAKSESYTNTAPVIDMLIGYGIIILLIFLFGSFIFLMVKEFLPEKSLSQKSSSIVADLVCAKKIEENATSIQEKENISWNEALYFSISSLYVLLSSRKDIDKRKLFEKLDFIVKTKYPQINVIYKKYLIKKFDFVEHIALNAKIIRESENKDWKESTYLAITLFYDDLVSKGSQKGLENLMAVVKNIYPDLTDDIITYGAWRYHPDFVFTEEFNNQMLKRHKKG